MKKRNSSINSEYEDHERSRPDNGGSGRYGNEQGPSVFPGMEDRGIGSIRKGRIDDSESDYSDYGLGQKIEYQFGDIPDDPDDDEDGERKAANTLKKGPFLFIAAAFTLLFLLLIWNLVHFNLKEKDEVLNSPYNKRQNSQADYVVRGEIKSIDGSTLAKTVVYDDGTEERVYPYYNIFAQVVGFASKLHGKSGVESLANYQLLTAHNNIIDQIINGFLKKKNPGDSVVTTLNAELQEICYDALGGYKGAVVVLEPDTGAIRAMVSKPNYDPNVIDEIWDEMVSDPQNSQLLNRATQGLYPPGSTFKIVTALAYFRKYGSLDGFTYDCTGEFEVGNSTVHCYNGNVHGVENFAEAFAHSCNTAFSEIGLKLGISRLSSTAKDLLFGSKLPCDIAASKPRWQLNSESDEVELVQTAFGQGKTVTTPYHMALICSAIFNQGVVQKPYLIDHIENNKGKKISSEKSSGSIRLMSEKEADVLKELMEGVVEYGTAYELSGHSYSAAGKTGSAEYSKGSGEMGTHSWFVGCAGKDGEELVIAVLAEDGGAGSSTAVPIAAEILNSYFGW